MRAETRRGRRGILGDVVWGTGGLGRCAGLLVRRRSTGRRRPVAPRNVYLCHPLSCKWIVNNIGGRRGNYRREWGESGCEQRTRRGRRGILGGVVWGTGGLGRCAGLLDVAGALVEDDQWHPEMFTCATRPAITSGGDGEIIVGSGGKAVSCGDAEDAPRIRGLWRSRAGGDNRGGGAGLGFGESCNQDEGGAASSSEGGLETFPPG